MIFAKQNGILSASNVNVKSNEFGFDNRNENIF